MRRLHLTMTKKEIKNKYGGEKKKTRDERTTEKCSDWLIKASIIESVKRGYKMCKFEAPQDQVLYSEYHHFKISGRSRLKTLKIFFLKINKRVILEKNMMFKNLR